MWNSHKFPNHYTLVRQSPLEKSSLTLFQWPTKDLRTSFLNNHRHGTKHPQKQLAPIFLVYNAWLAHMPPMDNRSVRPVHLPWVIHWRVAHLLFFIDTQVSLWQPQITWPNFVHKISQTGNLNLWRLCSPDMGCVIWNRAENVNEGQHGVFASQDWNPVEF